MGRLHKGGSTRSPEGSVNFPPWGFQTERTTRAEMRQSSRKSPQPRVEIWGYWGLRLDDPKLRILNFIWESIKDHEKVKFTIYRVPYGGVLPRWSSGKESICQCRRHKRRWVWSLGLKDPKRRKWQPTPVFLPGESHGQGSLAGYSPWGPKELDTAEWRAQSTLYRPDTCLPSSFIVPLQSGCHQPPETKKTPRLEATRQWHSGTQTRFFPLRALSAHCGQGPSSLEVTP